MAKSKKSSKKSSKSTSKAEKVVKDEAVKTEKVEKAEKTEKVEKVEKTEKVEKKEKGFFGKFFEKKCDPNENILTIFKSKKIYAALVGEIVGTMIVALLILTMGANQPVWNLFVILVATVAVYSFSGANLNPVITAGMMATRRMSAIRGVLYLLAQMVGAWFALLIIGAFINAGGTESELPKMAEVAEGAFWITTMLEFLGATIIGFAFARALQYKRSVFTFAMVVASGVFTATVVCLFISYYYMEASGNFTLNPAISLMSQILPTGGENVGEVLGKVMLALLTYVIFPMIGGVIGFYVADAAATLNDEDVKLVK